MPAAPKRHTIILKGEEELEGYKKGGYHPTHIGDVFSQIEGTTLPRYRVIQKLGWGSYATVWLAKDLTPEKQRKTPKYVVLKINISKSTTDKEGVILKWLKKQRKDHPGHKYVSHLLDDFSFVGPNGKHEVLVLKLVIGLRELGVENKLPNNKWPWLNTQRKRLAHEATMGLSYLHELELQHGDLHLGNIACTIPDIEQVMEICATHSAFKTMSKAVPSRKATDKHLPRYIYASWNVNKCLPRRFWEESDIEDIKVQIIDFGASTRKFDYPPHCLVPSYVRPPEILFKFYAYRNGLSFKEDTKSEALENRLFPDVWSLGCCIYEIMCNGDGLVDYCLSDFPEQVHAVQRIAGSPIPQRWQRYIKPLPHQSNLRYVEPRQQYWRMLSFSTGLAFAQLGNFPTRKDSFKEANQMCAMLHLMLKWEPKERMKVKDVLHTPWFKQMTDHEYERFHQNNPLLNRVIAMPFERRSKFGAIRKLPAADNTHRMLTRSKQFQRESGIEPRKTEEVVMVSPPEITQLKRILRALPARRVKRSLEEKINESPIPAMKRRPLQPRPKSPTLEYSGVAKRSSYDEVGRAMGLPKLSILKGRHVKRNRVFRSPLLDHE